MKPTISLVLALGSVVFIPTFARAQATPMAERDLVASVRAATDRYHDRTVAVKDGYRMIGPDIPSMGAHWINVPMLLVGIVDPARPPILEYVTIDGRIVLAGVAYAALVDSGAPLPGGFPVTATAWHFHAGTVDEESFILSHGHAGEATTGSGPRIAVLHLWAWLENPAGAFATDNWALPWLRLGWQPPAAPTEDAVGRAIALAAGGEGYFAAVINAMSHPDSAGRQQVREILARTKVEISDLLGLRRRDVVSPTAAQLERIGQRWELAWNDALAAVHHH